MDRQHFHADPDPTFNFDADPDTTRYPPSFTYVEKLLIFTFIYNSTSLAGVYILENNPPPPPGGGGGNKYDLRGKKYHKNNTCADKKRRKRKKGQEKRTEKWQNYRTRTMFHKIMGNLEKMQATGAIISNFSPYNFKCCSKKSTKIQLGENIRYFFPLCLYFFPLRSCNNCSTFTDGKLGGKYCKREIKYYFSRWT